MHRAFSLVELSIVLVILGLLVGGILAGQSLIRAAELRSVTADFQRYNAAYYSFRDRYMGIPGDFAKATDFWGSAGGNGRNNACYMAQTSSPPTCNGTGGGDIEGLPDASHAERVMAWKHLANAGLIEGNYTGKTEGASGTFEITTGINAPGSRLRGYSRYDLYYISAGNTHAFPDTQRNVNGIWIRSGTSGTHILSTEEAWGIDTKLDDGSPVYGRIITNKSTAGLNTGCVSSDAADATYILSNTGLNCGSLAYLMR